MADFGKNDFQDFDDFFCDFLPDDLFSFDCQHSSSSGAKTPNFHHESVASLPTAEIENLLLNDDFVEPLTADYADAFLSNLLVDSPSTVDAGGSDSSRSSATECRNAAKNSGLSNSDGKANDQLHQLEKEQNHVVNDDEDDPVAKKRKRQLRNRDAAVRSRERKKVYVRDLEMKSRYYDAECRRLRWMLQCAVAENHALQFALHKSSNHPAFGTSSTKQESAVLLLESLLLGSLLWVMAIVGLFMLPRHLLAILGAALLENVEGKEQRSLAPRKMESNIFGMSVFRSFMNSKRWRGSRTRIKVLGKRMCRCLMSIYLSS